VEEAQSYVEIMNISHLTQSQLALKIGKSQSTIANKIRLLNLSEPVQEAVRSHAITERHARALLSLDYEQQKKMLKTIQKKGLTVAQTEKMVAKTKEPPKKEVVVRKAISKSIRIAINTVKQAVTMIQRTGTKAEINEEERDDDVLITIRIPK
jgi:ParB family chromosome partitioning protein